MDNTPAEKWSSEQRATHEAFLARRATLEELLQKQKNELLAELLRTGTEMKELVTSFDEKVIALRTRHTRLESILDALDMYCARLSASFEQHAAAELKDASLAAAAEALLGSEEAAVGALRLLVPWYPHSAPSLLSHPSVPALTHPPPLTHRSESRDVQVCCGCAYYRS